MSTKKARKLRDISEFGGQPDLAYLQRKISSAGEMKSAIKKHSLIYARCREALLKVPWPKDWCGVVEASLVALDEAEEQLQRRMEDYLNVG